MIKTIKPSKPRLATILFIDLVASSESASVLKVQEYNKHVKKFQKHVEEVFENELGQVQDRGRTRDSNFVYGDVRGDEGVVILSTNPNSTDIQGAINKDTIKILRIALQLKYGWYFSKPYQDALKDQRRPPEIAIGINSGMVVFNRDENEDDKDNAEGYAINLAKRIESDSRRGEHSSMFVGESVFGTYSEIAGENTLRFDQLPRSIMKGITGHVRTYEIVFANLEEEPEILKLDHIRHKVNTEFLTILKTEFIRTRNSWLGNVLTNLIWDQASELIDSESNNNAVAHKLAEAIDNARTLFEIESEKPIWGIYLAQLILDYLIYTSERRDDLPLLQEKQFSDLLIEDAQVILKSIIVKNPHEIDARITLGRLFLQDALSDGQVDSDMVDKLEKAIRELQKVLVWEDENSDPYYYLAAANWEYSKVVADTSKKLKASDSSRTYWRKHLELEHTIEEADKLRKIEHTKEEKNLFKDFPFEDFSSSEQQAGES